jgi:glycosyltransferase involved in cell wall biosynthesis
MNQQTALEKINNFLEEKQTIGNYILPTVSIIITNYNYAKYLKEAIESVNNQDYPFIQKIIIDDCSTDNSKDILKQYEDSFEIVYKDKNEGQLAAFFDGLDVAKGEFIIYLDADDVLEPYAVSAHLATHLFKFPQVAFTCGRNRTISENSTLVSDYHADMREVVDGFKLIKPHYIHSPNWAWTTTSAMMFRKDVLDLIRTKNTQPFRVCADYYIAHFSNLLGGSMLLNIPMVNYRKHGGNNFAKNRIIGGPKPNGHLKYHNHPEHELLQKEILTQLITRRSEFESYFPNPREFAFLMGRVKDARDIVKEFEVDEDLKSLFLYVTWGDVKKAIKKLEKERKK